MTWQRIAVDLYSDTKTQPTAAMRRVIASAEAGDEQHFECPIVARLVERVADLLGHEAAVFLPSGTMANEIAILTQARGGDEVIAHRDAHIVNFEGGAAAALAGVMVRVIEGSRGIFRPETLRDAIRPNVRSQPRSRLVVVEQTTNLGGGAVWSIDEITAIEEVARGARLAMHLDGARLMNAVVASGQPAAEFARRFDTAWIDFTKGLGAPFGAVLAGSRELIEEAWRWKQRLGGAMRQAGMMAAGCLHALDHHVERLELDHEHARLLANGLGQMGVFNIGPVETNMVFIDVARSGLAAAELNARLADFGVRMSVQGATTLRAVTHLGVDARGVEMVIEAVSSVLSEIGVRHG